MNIEIPPGYGLRLLPKSDWSSLNTEEREGLDYLMDKLLIWEPPRRGHHYILGVDVSNGVGLDRSVIDVLRMPTLTEPAEQVAQFVTDSVEPVQLAYLIDPIGRFYSDIDGQEALAAVECNNSGISTQAELQGHLGYSNFYIWQYFDKVNPKSRFSRSFGWYTTRRTRPMMLDFYRNAINNLDPLTGKPDYIINSPHTIHELRDFQTVGASWEAEAASGAHDDCIMAGAISLYVSHVQAYTEEEPVSERRRRMSEEAMRKQILSEIKGARRDFQNTDFTDDEMHGRDGEVYEEFFEGE